MGVSVAGETGAAAWASYLVNGDSSGLEAREIELADKWAAGIAPYRVVDVVRDSEGNAQDPYFSWSFGLYTGAPESGGELLDYVTHKDSSE